MPVKSNVTDRLCPPLLLKKVNQGVNLPVVKLDGYCSGIANELRFDDFDEGSKADAVLFWKESTEHIDDVLIDNLSGVLVLNLSNQLN